MGNALWKYEGEYAYYIKLNDENMLGEGSFAQVYKI